MSLALTQRVVADQRVSKVSLERVDGRVSERVLRQNRVGSAWARRSGSGKTGSSWWTMSLETGGSAWAPSGQARTRFCPECPRCRRASGVSGRRGRRRVERSVRGLELHGWRTSADFCFHAVRQVAMSESGRSLVREWWCFMREENNGSNFLQVRELWLALWEEWDEGEERRKVRMHLD